MLRHLLLTFALVLTANLLVFSQTGSGTLKGKISDKYIQTCLQRKKTRNAVYRGIMTIKRSIKYKQRGYLIENFKDFVKVCDQSFL